MFGDLKRFLQPFEALFDRWKWNPQPGGLFFVPCRADSQISATAGEHIQSCDRFDQNAGMAINHTGDHCPQFSGEFPLVEKNGSVNNKVIFSLNSVPENVQVLVINFFAPDCKPCIMEVPDLKKIYSGIQKEEKMQFIAIGSKLTSLFDEEVSDVQKVAPEVNKFAQAYQLPYPVYVALTKDLKNFALTGFPESFILYRNEKKHWIVKRRFVGVITERDVKPFLHL